MSKLKVDLVSLKRDGFFQLKGVFSKDEIARFRSYVKAAFDEDERQGAVHANPYGSALSRVSTREPLAVPGINTIVTDPRVLEVAHQALGGKPVYFRDGSFQMGEGARGFHRDSVDRNDINAPEWITDDYPLYRFGVYMQDHVHNSGGLKVIPGSHNRAGFHNKKAFFIPIEAGDLLLWSLKLQHSGNVVLMKGLGAVDLPSSLEKRVPRFMRAPEAADRMGLFFTLGRRGPAMDRYRQFLLDRQSYFRPMMQRSPLDKTFLASLADKDIEIDTLEAELAKMTI